MLKKTLLFAIGALLAQGAFAEILSPEQALQRASAQKSGRHLVNAAAQPKLVYTAKTDKGQPAVYVFNQNGGETLLLSASNCAIPMLGYLDSGNFDPNNMPAEMQYWLGEYAAQIAWAEENAIQPSQSNVTYSYPSEWKFIAPLVSTKWDQTRPYNNDLANKSFATGCVATAMAQVMKYHNYPEIGHGSISYKDLRGNNYSMNFDEKPFDWANMIDNYSTAKYTEAQANAVAYLMKACGYSSQMTYGASSGTQVEQAAVALVKYFGYSDKIESLVRFEYSHTEWATILYDQLSNVGPVIYSGHNTGGDAHAFVCDGYDGQGYFHINWGWSGLCDGYYSLDAMSPTAQGTGGSSYGGFNFSQGMVINVKPSEGLPTFQPEAEFTLLGNVSGTNVGSILTLTTTQANPGSLVNNSLVTITPTLGISIENLETGSTTYASSLSVKFYNYDKDPAQGGTASWKAFNVPAMGPGSYIDPMMQVQARFDTNLPDGKYKVSLVWKDENIDNSWHDFVTANGCHDYVYVTKSGNEYTIENFPMYRFVIDSAEVVTPLYMRNPCQIEFTLTNPTDMELTQSIVPVLKYEGKASFEGDSQLVTLAPNETITTTLTYTFNQLSGGTTPTTSTPREYTLGAYDYGLLWILFSGSGNYGDSYYGDLGTVTMKRPGTNSSIRMRSISIANAAESGTQPGIGFIYGIDDWRNIDLDVTIEGSAGFVAAPLSAVIYEYDVETGELGNVVYEKNFENLIYVESGETTTQSTVLHMNSFDPSKIYSIQVYYVQQNARQQLGSIRFGASAGVDDIEGDSQFNLIYSGYDIQVTSPQGLSSIVVYDLSGKAIAAPVCRGENSVVLNMGSLSQGIYLVKATDAAGNTKTLKIRK